MRLPSLYKLKNAYRHSAISRIDPENLTPTMKLTLSRARIWQQVIGGNEATGLFNLKKADKGQAMMEYTNFGFHRDYIPFDPPPRSHKY